MEIQFKQVSEEEHEKETTVQQDGYVRFNSEYEDSFIEGCHHPDDDPDQYEDN